MAVRLDPFKNIVGVHWDTNVIYVEFNLISFGPSPPDTTGTTDIWMTIDGTDILIPNGYARADDPSSQSFTGGNPFPLPNDTAAPYFEGDTYVKFLLSDLIALATVGEDPIVIQMASSATNSGAGPLDVTTTVFGRTIAADLSVINDSGASAGNAPEHATRTNMDDTFYVNATTGVVTN